MIKQSTLFLPSLCLFLFFDPQPVYAYIGPRRRIRIYYIFFDYQWQFFYGFVQFVDLAIRVLVRFFKNRNL